MLRCSTLPVAVAALVASATTVIAQSAAEGIALPLPLTRPGTAAELSDGRVLISGRGPRTQIVVVDFARATVKPLDLPADVSGRNTLLQLWPMRNDSVLAWDASAGTGLILFRDQPLGAPPIRPAAGFNVVGVDAHGDILVASRRDATASDHPDSIDVLLVDASGKTLSRVRLQPVRAQLFKDTSTTPGPTRDRVHVDVRSGSEQAILFPDGWVAVARMNSYRVDWIADRGRFQSGEPLAGSCAHPDSAAAAAFVSVSPIMDAPHPALFALGDGRLLVRRNESQLGAEVAYDVVDRSGRCAGRMVGHPGDWLAGAGRSGLYIVETRNRELYVRRIPPP